MKKILFVVAIFVISVNGIYDANEAKPHQFPYSVLLHSPQFFCAGSLISDRHVLTAAHCLMSIRKGGDVKINVGAHQNYGYTKTDGKFISSKVFWIHENFTMPSAVFDIGIIELPEPLILSEKIRPVKISTKAYADLDAEDKEVVVTGWGYTEFADGVASELRFTKMDLIPLTECKKFKSHYVEDMNEDHICTEKVQGMPCSGDSGSSLVSVKTGKIVGILSYVKDAENGIDIHYNDCDSQIPAVSTRIASYLNWISEKTGLKFDASEHDEENEIDDGIDNERMQKAVKVHDHIIRSNENTKRGGTFQWN